MHPSPQKTCTGSPPKEGGKGVDKKKIISDGNSATSAATTAGAQMLPENRNTHDDTASDLDLVDGGWIVPTQEQSRAIEPTRAVTLEPTQPAHPDDEYETGHRLIEPTTTANPAPTQPAIDPTGAVTMEPTNPGSSHEAETGMVNEENDATNYGKVT